MKGCRGITGWIEQRWNEADRILKPKLKDLDEDVVDDIFYQMSIVSKRLADFTWRYAK